MPWLSVFSWSWLSLMSAISGRSISPPFSTMHAAALGGDLGRGEAPEQVVVDRAVLLEQRQLDEVLGAAVGLADDDVLRHVDETPRQVAGVRRTQGRVGQSLARAVGGGEVLEDVEALHEVRLHRALDDVALRVGHEAAHPGELADLLERATGARVGHHEDRVQDVEVLNHRLRDLLGARVPLLDDRLVALLLRDQAHVVLARELGDLLLVGLHDLALGRRDHDVVLGDRDAGLRGELEAEVLEGVEHLRDRRRAVGLHELVDELGRVALLHRRVDELVLRRVELVAHRLQQRPLDAVVVDDPADRREDVAALTARAGGTRRGRAA